LEDEAVYKFVTEIMQQFLPLPEAGKQYTASELYDVLLAAAGQDTSIDNICHSSEYAPQANTVRNRVREAYELRAVERRLNQALLAKLPKKLKPRQQVAIDLALNP
jgi:capsular polysaccharide biosynthesis protein